MFAASLMFGVLLCAWLYLASEYRFLSVTIFHRKSSSENFYIPVLHGNSVAQVEGCHIRQAHNVFEATVSLRLDFRFLFIFLRFKGK